MEVSSICVRHQFILESEKFPALTTCQPMLYREVADHMHKLEVEAKKRTIKERQ